jgi:medium-chain acyl-[acyl-carrier-protein] hydrolase
MEGIPNEALENDELMDLIEPMLRADFALCENYEFRPGRALACPLTVFAGVDDSQVTWKQSNAWSEHTIGGFTIESVSAPGHFYLHAAREQLARTMTRRLGA